MTLEGLFDSHLQSGTPPKPTACDYCQTETPEYWLFKHEPTSHLLCQECLAKFLETDIEDSDDHKGRFEGWTFSRSGFVGMFEATKEDKITPPFKKVGEVLEWVLIAEKRI